MDEVRAEHDGAGVARRRLARGADGDRRRARRRWLRLPRHAAPRRGADQGAARGDLRDRARPREHRHREGTAADPARASTTSWAASRPTSTA